MEPMTEQINFFGVFTHKQNTLKFSHNQVLMLVNVIQQIPAFSSAGLCAEASDSVAPLWNQLHNWVTWKRWGIWKVIYPSVFPTSVCQRYKSATVCCLRQSVCAQLNHCEWSGWKWPFCSKKASLLSMDELSALKLWSFFCFLFKPLQCVAHLFVNILHILKAKDLSLQPCFSLSLYLLCVLARQLDWWKIIKP